MYKERIEALLTGYIGFIAHVNTSENTVDVHVMKKDGSGMIRVFLDDCSNVALLTDLSVDKDMRKQGVATELMDIAERIVKEVLEVDFIELSVLDNSFMEEWYMRRGYKFLSKDGNKKDYVWQLKVL